MDSATVILACVSSLKALTTVPPFPITLPILLDWQRIRYTVSETQKKKENFRNSGDGVMDVYVKALVGVSGRGCPPASAPIPVFLENYPYQGSGSHGIGGPLEFLTSLYVLKNRERERVRESEVQMKTIIEFENARTYLGHLFFMVKKTLYIITYDFTHRERERERVWIRVKTSAVCGPHLQNSAEEEVAQTSAVCSKKTHPKKPRSKEAQDLQPHEEAAKHEHPIQPEDITNRDLNRGRKVRRSPIASVPQTQKVAAAPKTPDRGKRVKEHLHQQQHQQYQSGAFPRDHHTTHRAKTGKQKQQLKQKHKTSSGVKWSRRPQHPEHQAREEIH
ncbi:hypothetical protein LXL04_007089 [Taraxacum kok-saghyz]